jgi:hypothetical protein
MAHDQQPANQQCRHGRCPAGLAPSFATDEAEWLVAECGIYALAATRLNERQHHRAIDLCDAWRGRKPGARLRCEFVERPGTEHGHYFETVELAPRPFETSPDLDITYGPVVSNGIRLRTIVSRPKHAERLPALLHIERDGPYSIDYPYWPNGTCRGFLEAIARAGFVVMRVARPAPAALGSASRPLTATQRTSPPAMS